MAWVVDAPHLNEKPLNSHQALSSQVSFSHQLATSLTESPDHFTPGSPPSYFSTQWSPACAVELLFLTLPVTVSSPASPAVRDRALTPHQAVLTQPSPGPPF